MELVYTIVQSIEIMSSGRSACREANLSQKVTFTATYKQNNEFVMDGEE